MQFAAQHFCVMGINQRGDFGIRIALAQGDDGWGITDQIANFIAGNDTNATQLATSQHIKALVDGYFF